MKKIFFVTYGGGHANIVNLIAQHLAENSEMTFRILALTTAYQKLVDDFPMGVVVKLSDYIHLFDTDIEKILSYGIELLGENHSPQLSKLETILYLGLSLHELIQEHGEESARELYRKKKRQAFLQVKTIDAILKYENPAIVFSTTSPRFEQASIAAGNNNGYETVQILDLFGDVHPLPTAKHLIVMNEDVKMQLKRKGLSKGTAYHVYGQPVIENTVKKIYKTPVTEVKHRIALRENSKVMLFASQRLVQCDENLEIGSSIDYRLVYDKLFPLFKYLHEKYNLEILLRTHPNENLNDYIDYLDKFKFIRHVNEELNLEESIAVSDFVLVKTSTVALEAVAANKKVFTYMHEHDIFYSVPAFQESPFVFSKGLDELKSNLDKHLVMIDSSDSKQYDIFKFDCLNNTLKLLESL